MLLRDVSRKFFVAKVFSYTVCQNLWHINKLTNTNFGNASSPAKRIIEFLTRLMISWYKAFDFRLVSAIVLLNSTTTHVSANIKQKLTAKLIVMCLCSIPVFPLVSFNNPINDALSMFSLDSWNSNKIHYSRFEN